MGIKNRIFIKKVWGKYQAKRWQVFTLLLAGFFLLPWLQIDHRPAMLLDIPARKFHILWVTFWPQDTYLLALFLIACAVGLFMATAVVGRTWCGYTCPQTVGTSLFVEIERLIEGDRNQQIKLAQAPWTFDKIRKRVLKHGIFAAMAIVLSLNLMTYFVGATELLHRLVTLTLTPTNWFWFLFFAVLAYADFGHARDFVCKVPCPYGRFQGIMLDESSLVVSYDAKRGEPRQFFRKEQEREAGDCVNCNLCVDVCPTGIDIRKGPQYECISCMRCVDACDQVMLKVGFQQGLIRLASENELAGKPVPKFRPRLVVYGAILVAIVGTISFSVGTRPGTQLNVLRDRSFQYQRLSDGRISNVYMLKALNMDERSHTYRLALEGINAQILPGLPALEARSGEIVQASVAVAAPPGVMKGGVEPFNFVLLDAKTGKKLAEHPSTFIVPVSQANVPGSGDGT